ncbi:acetylxylan esterase [Cryptosporangium phraense]|uniref:Acetylxylan esterase n=1 Tax=Cryptosporangium phraense TaxID=2593070 RepID=A0A545AG77_9ACTN|nr:acetylxylan esterase [Cryptosporangium phraense]TQS40336.1 acetylxylan esterase [Cryptosporangium phraense]
MLTDLPLDQLRTYRSAQTRPDDFTAFWDETLADAARHDLDVRATEVETGLTTLTTFDVSFRGFGGEEIRAWLRVPAGASGPLPTVVQYIGYGGGRGHVLENLVWASAGFAHLVMDTRGQGAKWAVGDTADSGPAGPSVPGVMTRGIADPATYYYRRLYTDAVRAVDAARALPQVDADRIAVLGASQGGGLALAVAGLRDDLAAAVAYVPFLCDFPRSTRITDDHPYREIADYLATHRDQVERVHHTLSYFDGVTLAALATAPALISVALMDPVCPPSSVFGAANAYAGPCEVLTWDYNGHEGGGPFDDARALEFLRENVDR